MILSPAKTLDLSSTPEKFASLALTMPSCNVSKTRKVAEAMKKRKETELGKLLGISSNLAKTAHQYWKDFELDHTSKKKSNNLQKPCIFAFSGVAFVGLEATLLEEPALEYLQENLSIIDPLYGALRPLDLIQPYRLEMATRNVLPSTKEKLADWWKPAVTQSICSQLTSSSCPILLNLASDEYSAAVDAALLPEHARYIKIVFWEQGRVVAVHAKRARGLMVRYLAVHQITDEQGIQQFNEEGYHFVPSKSTETSFVFDRTKQEKKKPVKRKSSTESHKERTPPSSATKSTTKAKRSRR